MSSLAVSPVFLTGPDLRPRARPRQLHSQLTQVQASDISPWLYTALERIHAIEKSPHIYPGVADLTVTSQTAMRARSALALLFSLDLPDPTVSALSGGALGFAWSVGTRELEAVVYPDQHNSFVLSDGDEVKVDGTFEATEMASLEAALAQLLRG